ncbi:MAG: TrkA family potassium uptake protein [Coriobacteriia bacterium]|nr:TrkA family potassium uptake protein [Coriobacteriia bacterium]
MRVIIGGCGRVGSLLAAHLSLHGHEVAVVDQDPDSLALLAAGFAGTRHVGKVFDRETLESAGVAHADAYVAVTSGDNSNIVSAIVAKQVFRVPRVVSRIYDPRRAEIYRRLGIPAVSSVAWSVNEVLSVLLHPGLTTDASFGDGEVRLVSVEVPPRLVGRTVDDLTVPGQVVVAAIVRAGRSFVPLPGTPFEEHDIVHCVTAGPTLDRLEQMLRP